MPQRKTKYVFALVDRLDLTHGRHYIHRGDVWHADHPVVQAHPALFSEDPPEIKPRGWEPPAEQEPEPTPEPKVEQATKAPGEKRNTRRDR